MEFPASTTFRPSAPPLTPLLFTKCSFRRRRKLNFRRSICRCKLSSSVRVTAATAKNGHTDVDSGVSCDEFWEKSEFVEVIGIGSRNDAVFDFCMESPFQFTSLRYWQIVIKESMKAQLQRRIVGKDVAPVVLEAPMASKLCPKAVILVASAGYGLDLMTAVGILKTIRSANGFVVTIIMKPFSFEGQRRQAEAKNLMEKLREHTNLLIGLDTDMLLKKDLVTLDEAVKTANNAVLMAITAVSVLTSDIHRKFVDASHYDVKSIEVSEVMQVLKRFKEVKIGFGAGYNIKTSILRSLYDCPFLSVGVKGLDGMVICIVVSSGCSGAIDNSDVHKTLRTFRQTTEYEGEILISAIHEPSLEPNLLVTTVFILGFAEKPVSQRSSILSGLAQNFPFFFNLFSRRQPQSNDMQENPTLQNSLSQVIDSPDSSELGNINDIDVKAEDFCNYSEEPQTGTNSIYSEFHISSGSEQPGIESSDSYNSITEETPAFQRQPLVSWNLGHEYQITKDWGKGKSGEDGATLTLDNLSIFCLPVGVRASEELKDNVSFPKQNSDTKRKDDVKAQPAANLSMSSWIPLNDTGFEAVKEFYNSASAVVKGKDAENPKQGNLSVRAASMLEAERDSPKKWSPTVEMQYRGGIYKGRCQGGLPEGKGRLVLGDGSIYDGMWHYGKRSGLGTFYFTNGDALQGSWRDDVIHGKGWLYFHIGDRWFANFWKGKANGESRFYSKSGDVFFGHFRDGWRHGQFVCIDISGTRYIENWDQGVLVSRKLDSDNGDG